MDNFSVPQKRCTKCNEEKPVTDFHKNKTHVDGLSSRCRLCTKEAGRRSYILHRDKRLERDKQYYTEHRDQRNQYRRDYSANHRDEERERHQRYSQNHIEEIREKKHQYYVDHIDAIKEKSHRYRQENVDKIRERSQKYQRRIPEKVRERHREYLQRYEKENTKKIRERKREYRIENANKIHERNKRYYELNTDKYRNQLVRRRARKRNLPDAFTHDDWGYCVSYFNNQCAVCGRSAGSRHVLAMDHWIPLCSPDCPGTTSLNIIPLCHSRKGGAEGCNNSKNTKDAFIWLTECFGPQEARRITQKIQDYFDSLK